MALYPGHDGNAARAISADGRWVAGRSQGEGVDDRAVLWDLQKGTVTALDTLPGGQRAIAHALSGDGATIVGQADASDGSTWAVRWRPNQPPEPLGLGEAYASNTDGSVVTGTTNNLVGLGQAFLWTPASGYEDALERLNGLPAYRGYALSRNGDAFAGDVYTEQALHAARWTRARGLQDLGVLPGGGESIGSTLSGDGSVVYGLSDDGERGAQVFRWTAQTGMIPIFPVRDTYESGPATNGPGDVVVGRSYGRAFRWDAESGRGAMVSDLLAKALPDGWELLSATGVADDGRTIVGTGQGPDGPRGRGWVATVGPLCGAPAAIIEPPPEPPPPGSACGLAGSPCCRDSSGAACVSGLGCDEGRCAPCAAFGGLGVYAGDAESVAAALSRDGLVVVGWGRPSAEAPSHGLRWELPGGTVNVIFPDPGSRATGTNQTGSVAVGYRDTTDVRSDALSWSASAGVTELASAARAFKVSADGATVVGTLDGDLPEAFRWMANGGITSLQTDTAFDASEALALSADGQVIVGQSASGRGPFEATLWGASGPRVLGSLPDGSGSLATGASADGSVIVGMASMDSGLFQPFRWTEATNLVPLGVNAALGFGPATNAEGSVVAGTSRGRAFVWDARTGIARSLQTRLGELVPSGWVLLDAMDVSADGHIVVGRGRSPERRQEGWWAVLGPACEPAER